MIYIDIWLWLLTIELDVPEIPDEALNDTSSLLEFLSDIPTLPAALAMAELGATLKTDEVSYL